MIKTAFLLLLHKHFLLVEVTCADSEMKCDDGLQCVHRYDVCDGYKGCSDGSDESTDRCEGNGTNKTPYYASILHLHDHIISLRGNFRAHKGSLTPPWFIEVPVTCQESDQLCIFVLGISNFTLSTTIVFFLLNFGTFPTVRYFCFHFNTSTFAS